MAFPLNRIPENERYEGAALAGARKILAFRDTEHCKIVDAACYHEDAWSASAEFHLRTFYDVVMDAHRAVDDGATTLRERFGRSVRRFTPEYFSHSHNPSFSLSYQESLEAGVGILRAKADFAKFSPLARIADRVRKCLGNDELTIKDIEDKLGAAANEVERLGEDLDVQAFLQRKMEVDGRRLEAAHR